MSSRDDRDDALERVKRAEWQRKARERVKRLPYGWRGTGEDIRFHLLSTGLEHPHHHNAWGAMIMACAKTGLIEWNGRLKNMRGPLSHARVTKVYVRNRA